MTVNYSHDTAGRLSGVTGTYGSVSSYASSIVYRASGAVKSASFGNGSSETITYNPRLQPSGIRLTNGSTSLLREDYSYFSDGRLKDITDLDDTGGTNPPDTVRSMTRHYTYDHVGRVGTLYSSPTVQYYSYDTFDNLTYRDGHYNWELPHTDTASYANNKRSGWSYDPDGRLTVSPAADSSSTARNWTYNSAGQQASVVDGPGSPYATTYSPAYDGDGRIVSESTTSSGFSSVDYLVRSSVLGGAVISKVDGSGNKMLTNVQAGGLVFPLQYPDAGYGVYVQWIQRNPQGVTEVGGGGYAGMASYDPLGNYIPLGQHPPSPHPPATIIGPYYGLGSNYMSNANNYSTGCMAASGNPQDCSNISKREQMGDDLRSNLPGAYSDMWKGENRYVSYSNHMAGNPDGKSTRGLEWVYLPDTNGLTAKSSFAHTSFQEIQLIPSSREATSYMVDTAMDLLDRTPRCETMMNLVLETMAKNTGAKSFGTIRQVLEQFRKEGTLYLNGSGNDGQAGGALGHNAKITIGVSGKDAAANSLLFESFHIAGGLDKDNRIAYTDHAIYQAYHELGVVISVDEWMSIPSVKDWYAKEKTIRKYYVEAGLASSAQDDVCLGKPSPARPK